MIDCYLDSKSMKHSVHFYLSYVISYNLIYIYMIIYHLCDINFIVTQPHKPLALNIYRV